jgi:hypothetical protein
MAFTTDRSSIEVELKRTVLLDEPRYAVIPPGNGIVSGAAGACGCRREGDGQGRARPSSTVRWTHSRSSPRSLLRHLPAATALAG